jgi:hypothetical protein
MAQRNPLLRPVRIRTMPPPSFYGKEEDAFAPTTQDDDEQLATLAYISGATTGVGDNNYEVSSFMATMGNSVYSAYMNQAKGK